MGVLGGGLGEDVEGVKIAGRLKDFSGEGRFAVKIAPDFFSSNLEPLHRCRGVISMLEHDAMLRAEDGDAAGAMESCQALLVGARASGDEPYLVAAPLRFARGAGPARAL